MFDKNSLESGVSPVVGVILMVAVTVILAAVIGSFVTGLSDNLEANPSAGVTFDEDASNSSVDVQIVSIEDADSLNVTTDGGADVTNFGSDSVGDTATVFNLSPDEQITVTATLEGKKNVIQTYTYDG
jgi:flagellin-like protein